MKLWVDFNELVDNKTITADLDYAEFFELRDLVEGEVASLFDGVGHACKAVVISFDRVNRAVELKLDWQTWESPLHRKAPAFLGGTLVTAHASGERILRLA
jgi:hypothetical protein